jgi:protein SCO1/2
MSRLYLQLPPDQRQKLQMLFITVDPERDTVEKLKDYVPMFHPTLIGLTGTPEQIAIAAKNYGVYYKKVVEAKSTDYLMNHTSMFYFVDAEGQPIGVFRSTSPDADIIADIAKHLN